MLTIPSNVLENGALKYLEPLQLVSLYLPQMFASSMDLNVPPLRNVKIDLKDASNH